ncbi:MAG: hypothetical protein IBX56_11515, partial [Methylomicrobium sp.]|nr:hypothetical protein [Methylomicrobium sp.]
MSILVTSGRAAMAKAIAETPLHMAWGSGDPAWDSLPVDELVDATSLTNEAGRRTATLVGYCVPDEAGDIIVSGGRFQSVEQVTNHVYMRFNFDF